MLKMPKTKDEWTVAVASALAGFFFGGAAIAGVQKLLRQVFGIAG